MIGARTVVHVRGADNVLDAVGRAGGTDPAGLAEKAAALAAAAAKLDLDAAATASRDEGRGVVIAAAGDGSVLAARWFSPGSPSTIHGHGSWGVGAVVRGVVRCERWQPRPSGTASLRSVAEVGPGGATWFRDPPDDVHRQLAVGGGALEVLVLPHEPGDPTIYEPARDVRSEAAVLLSVYDIDQMTRRYRADAVLDANVPQWRFQLQGPAAARELVAEEVGPLAGLRVTDARVWYSDDGVIVEVAVRFDADGEEHRWREVHLVGVDGEEVSAHTIYCTGIWDAAAIARQALEAPMVRR